MIYHKLNMNYFDEKFKKNIKFKHDRNLIDEKYLKLKNIIRLYKCSNIKEKNV